MKVRLIGFALVIVVSSSGCYHASIETELPPSNQIVTQPWASCWVYGLVPPSTVETASECPNGVAKVETQLSFLNGLVGILTLGIYTPMEIIVTCAESSGDLLEEEADFMVAENASSEEVREVFVQAANQAAESRRAVFVKLGE